MLVTLAVELASRVMYYGWATILDNAAASR